MNELVTINDSRYKEYELLLLHRDQLSKEAGQIWTAYMKAFGKLITDNYEEKVECIKLKKTIACYQSAKNRGATIDMAELNAYLEKELAVYYANLAQMIEDTNNCREAGISTEYEVQRSKVLYRKLAKLLHPDINPETDRQEKLQQLWVDIVAAYNRNDIKALSELEVLTRRALKELGDKEIRVDIPDLEKRIRDLEDEIHRIIHTKPYTYACFLANDQAKQKKIKALQEELDSYHKYRQELTDILEQLIWEGGVKAQWNMN